MYIIHIIITCIIRYIILYLTCLILTLAAADFLGGGPLKQNSMI